MDDSIEFHVLGPLRVVVDGAEAPIATRRQRALVLLLLLDVGRVVPSERLIDRLWEGAPPPRAAVTLRSYVSHVRRALGAKGAAVLVTRGAGYCLDVSAASVDCTRMRSHALAGRDHLRQGRPREALAELDLALAAWGGDPFAEISDHDVARGTITELIETRQGAVEGRFEAMLALGRHSDALPGLEALTGEQPLREDTRALLMLALHRADRTAEALAAYHDLRSVLGTELGIDPSARLQDLHQRILEQDPSLDPPHIAPAPPPDDHGQTVGSGLVGRARELDLLRQRVEDLAVGTGSFVLIGGEPGIGKTALLEALGSLAGRAGVDVHVGRSPAADGAPAFWPWSQVLDSVSASLDEVSLEAAVEGAGRPVVQLSPRIAERVGGARGFLGDDAETSRFLLYESVASFVRQAARRRPMVVLLDDLHWADASSLELLSHLVLTVANEPVLLTAAYRDPVQEPSQPLAAALATASRAHAHELHLRGLDAQEVAELLAALLDGEEEGGADRLPAGNLMHERTGGNPFFVGQLARLMLDQGADADPSAVPPGVRHVVAQRLATLTDVTRQFLGAAAVVGRDFDLRTTAAVAELDVPVAMDAYDEAAGHGLLERAGGQVRDRRFVHALVQEAVLEGMATGLATRLHARAADVIEREGSATPAELARHRWAARDLIGARAVPTLVAAAEAAGAVYALDQAEEHLRNALDLARSDAASEPATELSVLLTLFQLIVAGRGWGDADVHALVTRAMELTQAGGFDDSTARMWWTLYFFLLDRDDPAYVQVADTLLETIQRPGHGIGHAARAVVHLTSIFSALHSDDRSRARGHLSAAREHVEAAPPSDLAAYDEHLHVMLLLIEGYWAALTGDPATFRAATGAAVALADADGRPFPRAVARTLGAASGPYLGDAGYVWELSREALELDVRFHFNWLASIARCLNCWGSAHDGGPVTQAQRTIEELLGRIEAAGRRGNRSTLLLLLADLYALEGRPDAAREALLRARATPGPYAGLVVDLVDERLARGGGPAGSPAGHDVL